MKTHISIDANGFPEDLNSVDSVKLVFLAVTIAEKIPKNEMLAKSPRLFQTVTLYIHLKSSVACIGAAPISRGYARA